MRSLGDDIPPGRYSLRHLVLLTTVIGLAAGNIVSLSRLRTARQELDRLRRQTGYLSPQPADVAAAVRVPVDEPLTYRFRIRVPRPANRWATDSRGPEYRLMYSTVIAKDESTPRWYGALAVMPGESVVTVRVAADPRDDRWKVSLVVRGEEQTRRIGTALPDDQVRVFRTSHDVITMGIGNQTVPMPSAGRLRLLDDRWLAGEGGALLYGTRPVSSDQTGIYVQLESLR